MGMFDSLMAFVGGGAGAMPFGDFGKWFGDSIDAFTGKAAVDAQRETNQMNIDLANTAVQRRKADMIAAGFNPLLAAGAPASSPALQSPGGNSSGNPIAAVMSLLQGVTSVQKTIADSTLVQMQQGKVAADTVGQNLSNKLQEGMNPLALTDMQQKVNFDRAANPAKLDMLFKSMSGLDLDNVNKALTSDAIRAGVDLTNEQKMKVFYDRIEQQFRTGNSPSQVSAHAVADAGGPAAPLSPMQVDLAAKVLALSTAGIELDNLKAFNAAIPAGAQNFVNLLRGILK